MSALDDLDAAEDGGKTGPTAVRREVESRDPEQVKAERRARWEALIPPEVTGKTREELEASLDLAHYAMGWPVNKLAQQMLDLSNKLAQEQGREPDDPKVARAAALTMIKTVERAALSENPFADVPKSVERDLNETSALARTLGWSPQQIGLMVKSALVQTEGDKLKAVALFRSYVTDEARERGMWHAFSLDGLESYADRGSALAVDDKDAIHQGLGETPAPQQEPYSPSRDALVYGARDEKGEVFGVLRSAQDLHEEAQEREIRARAADDKVAVLDAIAAATLKPLDYAVYRVMRDEAYRLEKRERGEELTKVVQEKLRYEKLQGADLAIRRVRDRLAQAGVDQDTAVLEKDQKVVDRLSMTTEQAIAEGLGGKPRKPGPPQVDL